VLARLVQDPKKHIDLIELMAVCIALGFEGRFGVVDNGRSQLDTLRRRLVEIMDGARGEYSKALSLHWRGATADGKSKWGFLPLWIAVGATLALLAGIYLLYYFFISDKSTPVFNAITAIRPPKVAAFKPPPVQVNRLRKFLEPEIKENLVSVDDLEDRSIVTLRGDGMFASGSTEVKPRYISVIERVTRALNEVPGQVQITGHTDNQPIRSFRFPSNFELSKERAEVVRRMIDDGLSVRNRTQAQGKGEAEPIDGPASNKTAEGRAVNRRVEVILRLPPAERDRELAGTAAKGKQ
jgi:type VI secretion system protein ImpK